MIFCKSQSVVIPPQGGIHVYQLAIQANGLAWIPPCGGMTTDGTSI